MCWFSKAPPSVRNSQAWEKQLPRCLVQWVSYGPTTTTCSIVLPCFLTHTRSCLTTCPAPHSTCRVILSVEFIITRGVCLPVTLLPSLPHHTPLCLLSRATPHPPHCHTPQITVSLNTTTHLYNSVLNNTYGDIAERSALPPPWQAQLAGDWWVVSDACWSSPCLAHWRHIWLVD